VLSVVLALVAALGFGSQFVALNEAAKGDATWGALAAVATYLVLVAVVAAVAGLRGAALRPSRGALTWILGLGLAFGAANVFYAAATSHGDLSIVAVAASLYPAVTVMLARGVLGERVRRIQEVGIVAAIGGILLIAAG